MISNFEIFFRCIDKFCDPRNVGTAELTDMMICAPWDTEMFSCLAGGKYEKLFFDEQQN